MSASAPTRPKPGRLPRRAPAVAVAVAVAAGVALGGGEAEADRRIDQFVRAWQNGDDQAAAQMTDRPDAAFAALRASRAGLDGGTVQARVDRIDDTVAGRRATVAVRWQVPRIGAFEYRTMLTAVERDGAWVVLWRASALHPRLRSGERLGTARDRRPRGRILDRDGRALSAERPVVDIALQAGRVRDPEAAARAVAELTDADADALASALRRAPRGRFIPAVTLREQDFDRVASRLELVRGISFARHTAPLAPTKTFARALLGAVSPATEEQIEESGGRLAAGDQVGQWGLQQRYERRLAGAPRSRVVVRAAADGAIRRTLLTRRGTPPKDVRTTLDAYVQGAAEAALGDMDADAALVALQASSGDILAVANRPAMSSYDRARLGLYPPGSTFKVVSTAALLRRGLDVEQTVDCPATTQVDGRAFRNFEGSAQGAVPFSADFAESCNTAFVALAGRLERDDLRRVAGDFGLGRTLRLGMPAADSRVPSANDPVERAASMIGQGRIVASPLTMAGVAATVADGRWRSPRLLAADARRASDPLPPDEAAALRTLMRRVVESGTGTALSSVPGAPIGKSGTAEYGSGDPPPTHAWFIASRDDVAVAVLVEGGSSGGDVAAPIAAKFFSRLDLTEGQS